MKTWDSRVPGTEVRGKEKVGGKAREAPPGLELGHGQVTSRSCFIT